MMYIPGWLFQNFHIEKPPTYTKESQLRFFNYYVFYFLSAKAFAKFITFIQ